MADTKVSDLAAATPVLTDLAYIVDDPGGTPSPKQCTWSSVLTLFKANTTLDDGSNVTITSNSSGEILVWNGSAWINQTLAEAGIQAADADTAKYDDVTANFTGTLQNGGSNVVVDTDIGSTVQAYDVDTLKADTADVLTAGYASAVDDDGTQSGAGTYTPDYTTSNFKQITNGGAFTLAPPSPANDNAISLNVLIINNGSAGTITTSGFTKVAGDAFTTTDTHKFLCSITVYDDGGTEYSALNVLALQ